MLTPLIDENGKSLGDIGKMIHDKHGFLWTAGAFVLSRFDGYQFSRVLETIDQHSLFIDSKDRLWASGLYSLVQIDMQTNRVRTFETLGNNDYDNDKIAVYNIQETNDGTVLFGTGYGISIFDESTKKLRHYGVQTLVNNEVKRTPVSSIEFFDDTTLLLGTEYGVFKFPLLSLLEATTDKLLLTDNIVGRQELIRMIAKINSDQYIFTHDNGFTYIDFSDQREIRYENLKDSKVLSDDLILAVHALSSEQILIGTNLGLDIFDLETLKISRGNEVFRLGQLEGPTKISSISQHEGTLYVATPGSIYSTPVTENAANQVNQQGLVPILRRAQKAPASTLNTVWSIGSDTNDRLMIGTHGLGAFFIEPNGSWTHYRSKTGELHSDNVSTFLTDSFGDLWVGMVGGISSNKNEQRDLRPVNFPDEIPKHGNYNVRTIRQAEDSTIWVLSMDWLAQFKPSMELLQLYDFNAPSSVRCRSYATTFVHLGETILVGCENGLLVIDAKEKKLLKRIETKNLVASILVDSHSTIWVLAASQLYSFQKETLTLTPVRSPDFFSSISKTGFFNMIEDQYSQIWIAYHGGVLVFDPVEKDFLANFGTGTSFEHQQIMFGQESMHLARNGDIFIGDVSGLFSFTPVELLIPPPPSVAISKIVKTFNDKSQEKSSSKLLNIASVASSPKKELVIDHTLEKIEFAFTDLDLVDGATTLYQHYLEGAEGKWSEPSEERTVSYLGLKPGSYKLHIRSLKNLQYSNELVFPFALSPHPLLSTPAKVLYAIIAIALIGLLSKLRSISLQRRVDMLEMHVSERTQELSDKNLDIEKLLNEKERMIENVFHQTRTPIQLLIANMDELKVGKILIPDYLEKQSSNVQSLIDLTDRVLADVHKHDAVLQYQNIALLLAQYAEKYSLIAKNKDLDFVYSSDNDLYLTTNTMLMGEVIDNLLSNSFKYTTQGYVKFSAQIENEVLTIIVEDSGQGIAEEDVAHVLSRGYRANGNTDKIGSGIGLSIVKENVGYLAGSISIDTKLNQGSKFSLRFPLGNQVQNTTVEDSRLDNFETEDHRSDAPGLALETQDVLLIEDNLELAAYYFEVLEKDYRVKLAHSGEEAIEIAIRDVPNLVISDIMMGELSGFDVVTALRQHPITRHIPLILLTAKADQRSKIQGFNVGANDYIVKPVQPHELSLRVRNQLNLVRYVEKHARLEDMDEGPDHSDEIAGRFLELVKLRYSEAELNSEDIARSLNITKKQLERKVKQVLGSTPKQFVNEFRLGRARLRLSRGEKVSTVFELCGFSSHAYFSKKFREKYGYTPSSFSAHDLTH